MRKQIAAPAQAQPATKLLETRLAEPGLGTMLPWLAVGMLAVLLVVPLWPVLFLAIVLLLVTLTPFVVGFKVLATLLHRSGVPARHACIRPTHVTSTEVSNGTPYLDAGKRSRLSTEFRSVAKGVAVRKFALNNNRPISSKLEPLGEPVRPR